MIKSNLKPNLKEMKQININQNKQNKLEGTLKNKNNPNQNQIGNMNRNIDPNQNNHNQSNQQMGNKNPKIRNMNNSLRNINNNNNNCNDFNRNNTSMGMKIGMINNPNMMSQKIIKPKRTMINSNQGNMQIIPMPSNFKMNPNHNSNCNMNNSNNQLNQKSLNKNYQNNNSNAIRKIKLQMNSKLLELENKIKELEKNQNLEAHNEFLLKIVDKQIQEQPQLYLPPIQRITPMPQPFFSQRKKKQELTKGDSLYPSMIGVNKDSLDSSFSKDVEIELLNNEITYLKNLFTRRLINIEKKQLLQDESYHILSSSKKFNISDDKKNIRYVYSNYYKRNTDSGEDSI